MQGINSVTIKGKKFIKGTTLDILKNRVNIVYGRNGSGKSTIAEAFSHIKDAASYPNLSARLDVELDEAQKERIYVFNDDFVRKQVKIQQDGIKSIVMLGDQVNISNDIEKEEENLARLQDEIAKYTELISYSDKEKERGSLKFRKKKLENHLKESDDSWAEFDKRIKGTDIKGKVNDRQLEIVIARHASIKDAQTTNFQQKACTLREELKERIKKLRAASSFGRITSEPALPCPPLDLSKFQDILLKTVESPHLSAREEYILDLIKQHGSYLENAKALSSDINICPVCFQNIDAQSHQNHKKIIERILNEEVKAFENEISKLERELESYVDKISGNKTNETIRLPENIETKVSQFRKEKSDYIYALIRIKDALRDKKKYLYQPSPFNGFKIIRQKYDSYKSILSEVRQAILDHNKICDGIEAEKKALLDKNVEYAALDNHELIEEYLHAKQVLEQTKCKLKEAENSKLLVENKLSELKSKLNDTKIAEKLINNALKFIFFSSRRLYLQSRESGDGILYTLKVNGHDVTPDQVSTGEANALGLAYYFASTFSGLKESDMYSQGGLYILDDPITSLDSENRVGILSLLLNQISKILTGSKDSKILILSHDLQTVFDLCKMVNDLNITRKKEERTKEQILFLENQSISPTTTAEFNEYGKLLERIYTFALTDDIPSYEASIGIGNMMRRVAEALSTFLYKCSITSLIRKKELLDNLEDPWRELYSCAMLRLVLHGQSHSEELARGMNPSFGKFSPEAIRDVARVFLLFLLDTHTAHIDAMLGKDSSNEILKWKDNLSELKNSLSEN